jgi:hypothetical protein
VEQADVAGRNARTGGSPLATALALLALFVQFLTPLALAAPRPGDAFAPSFVVCGAPGAPTIRLDADGGPVERPADRGKRAPNAHDCLLCCARLSASSLVPAEGAAPAVVGWVRAATQRPLQQAPRVVAGVAAAGPRGPPSA